MNPQREKEAEKLLKSILIGLDNKSKTDIVLCPPFVYLKNLKKISKKIYFGAQNSAGISKGAFTGEISPDMLSDIGMKYVILGHSERREMGEDNMDINKKIKTAISAGLVVIVCIGETARDKNHEYFSIVENQIKECLAGIPKTLFSKIIIAYEPVWAISTTPLRRDATPADSMEMILFIRKILSDISSVKIAGSTRIIYGGSVDDRDAGSFIKDGGAEGLLVGRASLDAKKFLKIIKVIDSI